MTVFSAGLRSRAASAACSFGCRSSATLSARAGAGVHFASIRTPSGAALAMDGSPLASHRRSSPSFGSVPVSPAAMFGTSASVPLGNQSPQSATTSAVSTTKIGSVAVNASTGVSGVEADGSDEDSEGHIQRIGPTHHPPTHSHLESSSNVSTAMQTINTIFFDHDQTTRSAMDVITRFKNKMELGSISILECLVFCDMLELWICRLPLSVVNKEWNMVLDGIRSVLMNRQFEIHVDVDRLLKSMCGFQVDQNGWVGIKGNVDSCVMDVAVKFAVSAVTKIESVAEIMDMLDRLHLIAENMTDEMWSHPVISETLVVHRGVLNVVDSAAQMGDMNLVERVARWIRGGGLPPQMQRDFAVALDAAFLDALSVTVSKNNQAQVDAQQTRIDASHSFISNRVLKQALIKADIMVQDVMNGSTPANNDLVLSVLRYLRSTLSLREPKNPLGHIHYALDGFAMIERRGVNLDGVGFVPEKEDYMALMEIVVDPRASSHNLFGSRRHIAMGLVDRMLANGIQITTHEIGCVFESISNDYTDKLDTMDVKNDFEKFMNTLHSMDQESFECIRKLEQKMTSLWISYDPDCLLKAIYACLDAGLFMNASSLIWNMRRTGTKPSESLYERFVDCVAKRAEWESAFVRSRADDDRSVFVASGLCVGPVMPVGFNTKSTRFGRQNGLAAAFFVLRDLRWTMERDGVKLRGLIGECLLRCSAAIQDVESGLSIAKMLSGTSLSPNAQEALESLRMISKSAAMNLPKSIENIPKSISASA